MKKVITFSVIIAVAFSSCKKESNKTCGKTISEIAGSYSLVKIETGTGGVFMDVTGELDECERSTRLTLNTNGTINIQESAAGCGEDQIGEWNIVDGKLITTVSGGSSTESDIVSFDCSTLVTLETEDDGGTIIQTKITTKK